MQLLSELRKNEPASFGLLTELVAGAHFLNPTLRAKLGCYGQSPRPIDPRPDYIDDGLLEAVIDRGRIYRPTP